MELDARNELNRVKEILKDAARCLAVYSTDNEKAQFCEMFLVRKTAVWCSHGSYSSFSGGSPPGLIN